ncbi:MAG: sigma-70 family RNA polymerase sigma factor [Clostridia bacterium]|nr:sigma-70 family RNA polymerase sigma factor [Clostridia bacterium]
MEDLKILQLLNRRSEEALAMLEARCGRLCLHIAQNILDSREDAEECVNDTWLRIWESIPPASPDSLTAYAGMIVRRLALNRSAAQHAARRDVRLITPLDELAEVLSAEDALAERIERHALTKLLNAFLEGLDRVSRIAFVRRYWYFDSIPAIAERLGMGEGAVRVRLHRTRKKLKAELERSNLM